MQTARGTKPTRVLLSYIESDVESKISFFWLLIAGIANVELIAFMMLHSSNYYNAMQWTIKLNCCEKGPFNCFFFFRVFCLLVWSPHCDSSIPSQAFINQGDFRETELLVMSAVVSGINLLLPGLFNLCAWIENNDSPSIEVYVSVFRWEEELSKKINHITLNICLLTDTSHRIILSR